MSITKAEIKQIILASVGGLATKVGDIDVELRDVLYELTGGDDFMFSTEEVTTEADTAIVADTAGVKHILTAIVNDDWFLDHGTLDEYEESLENEDIADPSYTGTPGKIFLFNGNFYFYDPIPDDAYTVRVHCSLLESDVDDIGLETKFREAMAKGVLKKLFERRLTPTPEETDYEKKYAHVQAELMKYNALYAQAIDTLRRSNYSHPAQVKYNDT